MGIYRFFLYYLLFLSCVFLTGYSQAETVSKASLQSAVKKNINSLRDSTSLKVKKQKLAKKKSTLNVKKREMAKLKTVPKPLDLSVPYTDTVKNGSTLDQGEESNEQKASIFANENKKKTLPVQVNGRLLMSPEPEAEKQKSADGAGIVINLKP
jgi:hypothetical protein